MEETLKVKTNINQSLCMVLFKRIIKLMKLLEIWALFDNIKELLVFFGGVKNGFMIVGFLKFLSFRDTN